MHGPALVEQDFRREQDCCRFWGAHLPPLELHLSRVASAGASDSSTLQALAGPADTEHPVLPRHQNLLFSHETWPGEKQSDQKT